MSNILVTGGSGYIGSHVVRQLHTSGHYVVVVDKKMQQWTKELLPEQQLFEMDYTHFAGYPDIKFDCVVHLAAEHVVPDSITNPSLYYKENVEKFREFLDYIVIAGHSRNVVFASSASVYGYKIGGIPLSETVECTPDHPYARTKHIGEGILKDYSDAYGLNFVALRYFQPSGADPDGKFGYVKEHATHLIPSIVQAAIHDRQFQIFGQDHKTKSGLPVRDYVHVEDAASATSMSVDYLLANNKLNQIFNVGGGVGWDPEEVVKIYERASKQKLDYTFSASRRGDVPELISDNALIKSVLGWSPYYAMDDMILHAYNWELFRCLRN